MIVCDSLPQHLSKPLSRAAIFAKIWLHVCQFTQEIAEIKLPDLNCTSIEPAMKIVEGTAKNMGITVVEA